MVKDSARYKSTAGWGWGRWRELALNPYGSNAHFAGECTTCHLPMRHADDVFTLPVTLATATREDIVYRHVAALPGHLPHQPLAWTPITMFVDPGSHTTAVLFGDEQARSAARDPSHPLALREWHIPRARPPGPSVKIPIGSVPASPINLSRLSLSRFRISNHQQTINASTAQTKPSKTWLLPSPNSANLSS